jgi:hypothetical protein
LRLFLGPSFKPGRAIGFKAQTALEALPAPLPQTWKGCRIEGLTVLEAFIWIWVCARALPSLKCRRRLVGLLRPEWTSGFSWALLQVWKA